MNWVTVFEFPSIECKNYNVSAQSLVSNNEMQSVVSQTIDVLRISIRVELNNLRSFLKTIFYMKKSGQ